MMSCHPLHSQPKLGDIQDGYGALMPLNPQLNWQSKLELPSACPSHLCSYVHKQPLYSQQVGTTKWPISEIHFILCNLQKLGVSRV